MSENLPRPPFEKGGSTEILPGPPLRKGGASIPVRTETVVTSSAEETMELGRKIAAGLRGGEVIAVSGPFGAGKTVLIKGIAEGLGVADTSEVRSPTFVLLRTYEGKTAAGAVSIHHLDAYRLRDATDFDDLGALDLMGKDTVLVIEWADRIAAGLPEKRADISLEHVDPETRKITVRR